VDSRHLVVHSLLAYDRHHGTDHFRGITVDDVTHHEAQVDEILEPFALPESVRSDMRAWYLDHFRDPDAVAASHRPYQGVLGVIRWFQLQPRTHVALNTGRLEALRELTLASLNALGRLHRVAFDSELLFMNGGATVEEDAAAAKVDCLRRLRVAGYRIVAVVDNEPAMIRAMSEVDETGEILFLHADTIFASRREPVPRMVSGSTYGLSGLIDEAEVGRRIRLVWHGVNDRDTLHRFITSDVQWAELDARRDPVGRLVLRLDPFHQRPWSAQEEPMPLRDCLDVLRRNRRSVKLDLEAGGDFIVEVLEVVGAFGFADDALWFNGSIDALGKPGFRRLRSQHPGAIVQTPIDFLVPLFLAAPDLAEDVLIALRGWGVTRVSLDWRTPGVRHVLDVVEGLGWDVNLWGIPDLESFLEAALLLPASVTVDLNFPAWRDWMREPAPAMSMTSRA
jgi:hypothetical protein